MKTKAIFLFLCLFMVISVMPQVTRAFAGAGICSANAFLCPYEISCTAAPPPGGSTMCADDGFMAVCLVFDENGQVINRFEGQCSECI